MTTHRYKGYVIFHDQGFYKIRGYDILFERWIEVEKYIDKLTGDFARVGL